MPVLEIQRRSADPEFRELEKRVPLLVGSLDSNEIQVPEPTVAPVHCRISWKRGNFEVEAVTERGVEWNGSTVFQAVLSPGDIVRIGTVELVVHAEQPAEKAGPGAESHATPDRKFDIGTPSAPPAVPEGDYSLKPGTEDSLPVRSFHFSAHIPPEAKPAEPVAASAEASTAPKAPVVGVGSIGKGGDRPPTDFLSMSEIEVVELQRPLSRSRGENDAGLMASAARLKQSLHASPRRPGEQEVLRSPLVIGLGVGVLLLLLAAATVWLVLTRDARQREFDAARTQMESGQYTQAIEGFERFLREHPHDRLAGQARGSIAMSRVDQPLAGAVPSWENGLSALDALITDFRDTEEFQDLKSTLRQFVIHSADRIAFGAAEAARTGRKTPLLSTSASAARLLELYSPPDSPPTERLQEIARTARAAEAAILERETLDGVVRKMDEALAAGAPLRPLAEYRRLLDRYPSAAEYRPLAERLKKIFELERSQTHRDDTRREAAPEDRPRKADLSALTLTRRIRTRSDIASVGNTVFVVAEDSLFGVDTTTGEPLWRRVVGFDQPFDPQPAAASVPALLAYDTRYRELLLLERRTGKLLWRLPLDSPPQGAPLVHEGQIVLATAGGTVELIDLQSGAATSRLKFSQGVVGPPVVSLSGERLYLPGHADVLYILSRRPLACEQVTWLGHGPGGIVAPSFMMRAYLLLAENDRAEGALLRMFDTTREDQPPRAIARERIGGQVRDSPAIRGKQLIVPSSPERVSAFTVAETGNEQSLSFVGSYQVQRAQGGPIFVTLGPDDQMWMVSSALRRLTISRESLLPDKQELAVGLASQPLQVQGEALFVGRRVPFSRAVLLSEVDRLRMTTQWQSSFGAQTLAMTAPAPDGTALCVTSVGELFQVTPERVDRGGFEMQALGQTPIPDGTSEALSAVRLEDGRVALWNGGRGTRMWITGNDAVVRETQLAAPLEAAPVSFGPGLLLPLAGRLRLAAAGGDGTVAEDLPSPVTDSGSAAWRSVARLDDTQAVALDSRGRLIRVQYRTSPVPHLAEVTDWLAGGPVDQPFVLDRGRIAIVEASGRLVLIDAASFERLGDFHLQQPAARSPWLVDELAFVESAGNRLVCFNVRQGVERRWELELSGGALVGAPLRHDGMLLVALTDGRLLRINPENGEVLSQIELEQRIGFGPQVWGKRIVVGTLDGSLLNVERLLEKSP